MFATPVARSIPPPIDLAINTTHSNEALPTKQPINNDLIPSSAVKKVTKKRKPTSEFTKDVKKSKSMAYLSSLVAAINLDTQCGVSSIEGSKCARAISCKMHAVTAKR